MPFCCTSMIVFFRQRLTFNIWQVEVWHHRLVHIRLLSHRSVRVDEISRVSDWSRDQGYLRFAIIICIWIALCLSDPLCWHLLRGNRNAQRRRFLLTVGCLSYFAIVIRILFLFFLQLVFFLMLFKRFGDSHFFSAVVQAFRLTVIFEGLL